VPGHDPIPGYLSLHLNQSGLTLKWTPNQLMNGSNNGTKSLKDNSEETNSSDNHNTTDPSKPTKFVYFIYEGIFYIKIFLVSFGIMLYQ
jgi:hypothetical protein